MISKNINLILILLLVFVVVFALIFYFKRCCKVVEKTSPLSEDSYFTINTLCKKVNEIINREIRTDVSNLNLNKAQAIKKQTSISILRKNIHTCIFGDLNAKNYVKQVIRSILIEQLNINNDTINKIPQFQNNNFSSCEKFDIILSHYKKQYGYNALEKMIQIHKLDTEKYFFNAERFVIDSNDIDSIYDSLFISLDEDDKIQLLTQWIYQRIYGYSVVDEIRDMNIDGLSGGVGGLNDESMLFFEDFMNKDLRPDIFSYNHICIMYHGITIYLAFMGFGTQRELVRVCKNICRFNSPGQFSQDRGYIKNDLKDGSRVTVVRPPTSYSWAFVLRKHGNIGSYDLKDLFTEEGSDKLIKFLEYIAVARKNVIFTGNMAVGKSTTMRSFLKTISKKYNLRIQEALPELHFEKIDPYSNILSFRETPTVSGNELLELQKTTDGAINAIGEIASPSVAAWYIQTSQNASLMSIATNHCMTTDSLLKWFRNALIMECNFTSPMIALEQVVEAIQYDVHMEIDHKTGHRYIERITEVVPVDMTKIPWDKDMDNCMIRFFKESTEREVYKLNDIFIYSDGKYVVNSRISNKLLESYRSYLSDEEFKDFESIFEGVSQSEL